MKVNIEIEMQKAEFEYFKKMAKSLKMDGPEVLLEEELRDHLERLSVWFDRVSITEKKLD